VEELYRDVMFEPWSMGDAVIAAAIAREDPERFTLLCDERWGDLIRMGLPDNSPLQIVGVHLPYTMRNARHKYSLPDALAISGEISKIDVVFNIRGDIRDRRASRKLFPGTRIRQSGWFGFVARRSAAIDALATHGFVNVRNRYKAWCDLTGVSFDKVVRRYRTKVRPKPTRVVIHIGAQWGSRRYPHVLELTRRLQALGIEIDVVRGPGDRLTEDLPPGLCAEISGAALAECFRSATVVVANDSGPMHFAAYLGCNTLCIGSVSNLVEWIPPTVCAMTPPKIPRGYRPLPNYMSDRSISEWPAPGDVVHRVLSILGGGD